MTRRTWREEAATIIWEATRDLPPETDLKERIRVVREARPSAFKATSWGKKSWQAARREYLVRFGYVPRTKRRRRRAIEEPALDLFSDIEEART